MTDHPEYIPRKDMPTEVWGNVAEIPDYITHVTGYNVTLTVDAVLGTEAEPQVMTVKIGDVDLLTEAWWDEVKNILDVILYGSDDYDLVLVIRKFLAEVDKLSGDLDEEVQANRQ